MMTGRKRDVIWGKFEDVPPSENNKTVRAKCKKCGTVIVGLVQRMRTHVSNCKKWEAEADSDPGKF